MGGIHDDAGALTAWRVLRVYVVLVELELMSYNG